MAIKPTIKSGTTIGGINQVILSLSRSGRVRSVRFSYHVGMTAVICLLLVKSGPPHEQGEHALYPVNRRGGA